MIKSLKIIKNVNFVNGTIIILFIITALSCVNEVDEKEIANNNPMLGEPINYLALGDSYTIGQGVEESARWPNQLGEELRGVGYDINSIDIIARTGWTSNNLLRAIDNTEIGDYNLVSLLIGVNNQYQSRSFASFEDELESLLNFCVETAGSYQRVFVVSIPDYGVTPLGSSRREMIGQEIDMYNEYIAAKCLEKNIPFIDITEISRGLGDSEGALAPDNLHPSGRQYGEWVKEILPVVLELLSKE
jgi:lysophospholipase L1-like esterase